MAAALAGLAAGPALAQDADQVAAGEIVFHKRCVGCHQVGEGARNRVGPTLNDVIGRTAGTEEGFRYSKPMKQAGEDGLVWTDETLFTFLEKPKGMIKGTKMGFPGMRSEEDRHAVIAFLEANGGEM